MARIAVDLGVRAGRMRVGIRSHDVTRRAPETCLDGTASGEHDHQHADTEDSEYKPDPLAPLTA
jgi:hypothetical protein